MARGLLIGVLLMMVVVASQNGVVNAQKTMNDYMNFPFVYGLAATAVSQQPQRIAYVVAQSGINNIYIADGPQFVARKCTNYTKDTASLIQNIAFSADGNYLYFTIGTVDGGNPQFLTNLPASIVIQSTIDCQTQTTLPDYSWSTLSPSGTPTFALYQTVYEYAPTTGQTTQLFEVGDVQSVTDLSWSPDGQQLLFTNGRGDHSFVGVYTRGNPSLQYLGPSFDTDLNPVWSPDGSQVAFYRIYSKTDAGGNVLTVEYSIVVANIATGQTSIIYSDTQNGYPYTAGFGNRPLAWFSDSLIIFPCEFSGWLHVCGIKPIAGATVVDFQGTQQCEVQEYNFDQNYIYYAHNCLNINGLHISRLDPTTSESVVLTPTDSSTIAGVAEFGLGIAPLGNGKIAFVQSGYNYTGRVIVAQYQVPNIQVTSGTFQSGAYVQPKTIQYPSLDGQFTIYGQLFLPPNLKGTAPAVLFTHGGPARQMYNAIHYCGAYAQLYAQNQYLANNGIVVLSINYRMGAGYGKAFRDCAGCGWLGAAEYIDIYGANKWLASQTYVDPTRIGVYGLSYGGLNTLQALSRNSDVFKVGVANAPVFNWISSNRYSGLNIYNYNPDDVGPEPNLATPQWPSLVNNNMNIAWKSSPSSFIQNFTSPVLVIQGDADINVDIQESIGLIRALRSQGIEAASIMYPNEVHGLSLWVNIIDAAEATFNFLVKYL